MGRQAKESRRWQLLAPVFAERHRSEFYDLPSIVSVGPLWPCGAPLDCQTAEVDATTGLPSSASCFLSSTFEPCRFRNSQSKRLTFRSRWGSVTACAAPPRSTATAVAGPEPSHVDARAQARSRNVAADPAVVAASPPAPKATRPAAAAAAAAAVAAADDAGAARFGLSSCVDQLKQDTHSQCSSGREHPAPPLE